MRKKIGIIGGGISGLSLAWYLKKFAKEFECLLFEKSEKVGGVIGRYQQEDLILDSGPKTFRESSCSDLLSLIEELDMQNEIIESLNTSKIRYIYVNQKLCPLPLTLKQFLFSSLTFKAIPSLVKEIFVKKTTLKDESVGAFARRRFGNYIAEHFFDPFVMGVCGCDMDKLSIVASFPFLKELEEKNGSIIRGLFKRKKQKTNKGLFNLKGGLQTLVETLEKKLEKELIVNCEVSEVVKELSGFRVKTAKGDFFVDYLFLSLPIEGVKRMKLPFEIEKDPFFFQSNSNSLVGVSVAYQGKQHQVKGFGYLVPSKEKEALLGVIFDSEIFSNLDASNYQTKLTLIFPASFIDLGEEVIKEKALDVLSRHLAIEKAPDAFKVFRYPNALVNYPVFHKSSLDQIQFKIRDLDSRLILAGNYMHPPGVNHCVKNAKTIAKTFQERL